MQRPAAAPQAVQAGAAGAQLREARDAEEQGGEVSRAEHNHVAEAGREPACGRAAGGRARALRQAGTGVLSDAQTSCGRSSAASCSLC